ncbi:unnamed protein product [Cylicocyclus nassatus]|uniref:Replication termination factor 2 n=1 Tax=Cylicocyclus nassatus TaxID=53992 RepID=A0AA36GI78_CYLNA|nr:unnamed protein product [Cylicocyclus nassatus]
MGADGGTIPKRCELVKKKKKAEKLDRSVKNASKWRNCQLSQQPLKKPIIACRYGRLYNKETVIEAILTKTIQNYEAAAHIKGLKDFKELKLRENKDFKKDEVKGDEYLDSNQSEFLCPVTSLPMNGINKFIVNWKCGCVFSERAVQEVKSNVCYGCSGPWDPKDSVVLYPDEELLEEYKQKLAAERAEKKNKKKNGENGVEKVNGESAEKTVVNGEHKKEEHGHKKDAHKHLTNSDKDKLKKAEKRKLESDIQSDPTKSEAYKKLFTTCEEAKNKPAQHWITYNPLYY